MHLQWSFSTHHVSSFVPLPHTNSPSYHTSSFLTLSVSLTLTGGSQGTVCGPHHTAFKHKLIIPFDCIIQAFTADLLQIRSLSLPQALCIPPISSYYNLYLDYLDGEALKK